MLESLAAPKMDALPFPLLSQIFLALQDNPSVVSFALLNKTCYTVAVDPINLAKYLLAHHGPCQALSYALSNHFFTLLTEPTVRALLTRGALFPRYLAQQLANGFCRHKRQSARAIAFLMTRAVDQYGDFDVRADDWKRIGEFLVEFAEASKMGVDSDTASREVSRQLTEFISATQFIPVLYFPNIATVQSSSAHRATSLHYILFAVLHAAPEALQWMIAQDFDLRTLNPASFIVGFLEVVREMFTRGGKDGVVKMIQTILDNRLVIVDKQDLKDIWAGLQKFKWQSLVEATKMISWGFDGIEKVAHQCILDTFETWEKKASSGNPEYPYRELYKHFPCRDALASLLLNRLADSIPPIPNSPSFISTSNFTYNPLCFDISNDESVWLVEILGPHHRLSRLVFENVVATLATAKLSSENNLDQAQRHRRGRSQGPDLSTHPNADPLKRIPVFWDFIMRGTPITKRHVSWFQYCEHPEIVRLLIKIVRRFGIAESEPTEDVAPALTRKRKRIPTGTDDDDLDPSDPDTHLRTLLRALNESPSLPSSSSSSPISRNPSFSVSLRQTRSRTRTNTQITPSIFHSVLIETFPLEPSQKRRKWDICSNPTCVDPEFAIRHAIPSIVLSAPPSSSSTSTSSSPSTSAVLAAAGGGPQNPLYAKDGVGLVSNRRLKCCSRCRAAFYCSKLCQRCHWRVHRGGCVSFDEARQSNGGSWNNGQVGDDI